jgi:DNA-binding NtrC family response regulator
MVAGTENRNILVVDDERQITRVLKTALSSRGYGIRTAADGDEALHILQDWWPDVVITDLRMPNLDGLGVQNDPGEVAGTHHCFVCERRGAGEGRSTRRGCR